jgi:hypothetical protein
MYANAYNIILLLYTTWHKRGCDISPKKNRVRICSNILKFFQNSLRLIFTREYTKCTAGSTFCFVVVVVVVVVFVLVVLGKPLIKLASISADSWSNMIRHDQTWSDMIRKLFRHDQTWSDTLMKLGSISPDSWSHMIRQDHVFYQTCSDLFLDLDFLYVLDFLNILWIF